MILVAMQGARVLSHVVNMYGASGPVKKEGVCNTNCKIQIIMEDRKIVLVALHTLWTAIIIITDHLRFLGIQGILILLLIHISAVRVTVAMYQPSLTADCLYSDIHYIRHQRWHITR